MLQISCCHTYSRKRCLDHNDLNSYRPVSNLCFIANILVKHVLSQVSSYLNSHNLCNTCKSAHHPCHSIETALLIVANDLFLSLSKGSISVLVLLDFSSAFDKVDHPTLVHRLHTDFGFTDTVLQWFSSYLTDRTSLYLIIALLLLRVQFFAPCMLSLCLPLLTHTLSYIIHLLMTYNYRCLPPDRTSELLHSMQSCISDVKAWATVNMLKLNDNQTYLMLVTCKRSKHLHSLPTSITIGKAQIPFKQSV